MVRKEVPNIVGGIAQVYPDLNLHVAFVGYRDHDDKPPLEVLGFADYDSARPSAAVKPSATTVSRGETPSTCGTAAAGRSKPSGGRAAFEAFVAGLRACGGGDTVENVFSGLEAAAGLQWQSVNRIMVHIADAPCHGREFHNLGAMGCDAWGHGDKLGRDVSGILTKLRFDAQVDTYLFCHLTTSTHPSQDGDPLQGGHR